MTVEKHRFAVLDAWRGIAASLVALYHFRDDFYSHLHKSFFINHAWLFVDFFFILSGFVIFANYEEKLRKGFGFWRFMTLRFGRLYPLHLFVLLILIGVELLQLAIPSLQQFAVEKPFGSDADLAYLPWHLLLAHNLGFTDHLTFNVPSWTISAEFYTYALFGLLIVAFKKNIDALLPLIAVAAGGLLFFTQYNLHTSYEWGFVRCIYSFALGGFLWRLFQLSEKKAGKFLKAHKGWAGAFEVILLLILFFVITYTQGPLRTLVPVFLGLMLFVFAFESGIISRLLKKKPFLFLGALSYSIYMLHSPIADKLFGLVSRALYQYIPGRESQVLRHDVWGDNLWQGDLIVLAYFLTVVGASVFTYYLVEMPGRAWFRRLATYKTKAK